MAPYIIQTFESRSEFASSVSYPSLPINPETDRPTDLASDHEVLYEER